MSDFERVLNARNSLKRSWQPFFSRFGRLTPVQIETIPVILSGNNALICAPTATGKTEAVVAPVSEVILKTRKDNNLECIYISPTRALVNDLAGRLTEPLNEVGLTLGIWTGDHHNFNPQAPTSFLLTTPESLDSVICRFPQVLKHLQFGIFDELHLVDGTCRGDQLMILRKRLQDLSPSIRLYGMSATIKHPEDVLKRYIGPGLCISVAGGRGIVERIIEENSVDTGLKEIAKIFRAERISKALFFCNSRALTEKICIKLQELFEKDRVFVHHGSLPRGRREATEHAFREREFCFCVATMTLEVGIDIGDIDAVVLVGPPSSISSLLQRVGRGSRRKQHTLVFGLPEEPDDITTFRVLFELAKRGQLEEVTWKPAYSVAVQQTLSLLFQNQIRGITANEVFSYLCPLTLSSQDFKELISHLSEKGYIITQRGLLFPSQKTLNLARRGVIHSNISNDKGFQVVNSINGEKLGEISYLDTQLETFILGGKLWKVKEVQGTDVSVVPYSGNVETLSFVRKGTQGAFFFLLPTKLKQKTLN